ncbi:HU family DNA-binding protein [Gammaproteobacteria bacterium]|nr:HU family DNA-binding protein [Gammaproteobacteria bacterium]
MSLSKKDISKNISTKAQIHNKCSEKFLNSFIAIITNYSKKNHVKISNFGSFYMKESPARKGRNPKTMESYNIPKTRKLNFNTSQKIKELIN